jgi:dTDP-glucose 4,6-dehydratase
MENLLRSPNFTFVEHDVIFPLEIEGPVDWVMHFASPASPPKYLAFPIETMRVNSEGTMHLLQLAKEKQAGFFLASTSEIYGDPTVHPQPESYYGNVNSFGARSCYNEAKRYAEAITYWMNRKYGIPVRVIRIFNTFGPKMDLNDGRVITNFLNQMMSKKNITVYGDGSQTRSFQYIDDLLEGITRMMSTPYERPVNLGNPEEVTVLEVACLMKELMKSPAQIEFLPLPEDDPRRRKPDITISRTILDWEPAISLRDALARTIHYYQGQYIH